MRHSVAVGTASRTVARQAADNKLVVVGRPRLLAAPPDTQHDVPLAWPEHAVGACLLLSSFFLFDIGGLGQGAYCRRLFSAGLIV